MIYQKIDISQYADESKQKELLKLLADSRNVVTSESEQMFFKPVFRSALFEYLQHHSLSECLHEMLFKAQNSELLAFFVQRWSLSSTCEKKLFEVKYRPYLKLYFQRECLVDAENESLLFSTLGIVHFRRFYMERYEFHNRDAEAMLLMPEYAADLQFYIRHKHRLFSDFAEILADERPEQYAEYVQYCS
jgi:hypothetical protein